MVDAALQGLELDDLDASAKQRLASDPSVCVWVGASAGTGKTKVLTDRVLRLLLPQEDGRAGSPAHKILCLTFTKAGASEMLLRISRILARWAVAPEGDLVQDLDSLYGRAVRAEEIAAARRLFADVVDVPGGLKIMTIHSFCQSVLGRFPLEAGVSPNFTALEEAEARALLLQARAGVFEKASGVDVEGLSGALDRVARLVNEEQFMDVLGAFVSERAQFFELLQTHFDVDGLYTSICGELGAKSGESAEEILAAACGDDAFDVAALRGVAQVMIEKSNKTDQGHGAAIAHWLSCSAQERQGAAVFAAYRAAFFTGSGDARKKLCGAPVVKLMADAPDVLAAELQRLVALEERMNAADMAMVTRDLCRICAEIVRGYEGLKARGGLLDFDDLILKVLALLKGRVGDAGARNSGWVQYKLDQGVDHILVDEAQDTNPEQWQIVEALCDDFFDGEAAGEDGRTIFVVGDEKQSIYSFQRASPEEFNRMRTRFSAQIEARRWRPVNMDISFRSTHSVLSVVDAVFKPDEVRRGLGEAAVQHHSWRRGQAGLVELWPLFEPDEAEAKDGGGLWDMPTQVRNVQSGAQKLADYIAQQVSAWIELEEILPSHGRAVQAGDIMILVRKRGGFTAQLSKALKTAGVPVGGVDRMVLGEQLAVQDLMAAARFALLPQDDLNLACLLKSPFVGMDEDGLYDLAQGRSGDLWLAVQDKAREDVLDYLKEMMRVGRASGPYDFMNWVLQHPCPADVVSGRKSLQRRLGADCLDAVDEFLNAALLFEQKNGASLQHFIYAQERGTSEIKREQEEGGGFVRIMTVHGSKGLQAPIVILPDTVSTSASGPMRAGERFLWPKRTGMSVPLWAASKGGEVEAYRGALDVLRGRGDDEYRRLLYVAMTRAEDRLYVAGALGKRKSTAEGCWYNLVRDGLRGMEGAEVLDDGGLRLSHAQISAPDRAGGPAVDEGVQVDVPAWLHEPVSMEDEVALDVLRPSQMLEVAASPIAGKQEHRFLRGNLTHKLLQILPGMARDRWEVAASGYLARYGRALSPAVQENIVRESVAVLEHPDFADVFGADSRAEVPITGVIAGRGVVNGQVDRLVVRGDEVLIVDFKTNRPPPTDAADIPQIYRDQLQLYAEILRQIYPDKRVRGALLWTDGANLMEVTLS
jgi:ATP-dependent helicase/nuclease subunit A